MSKHVPSFLKHRKIPSHRREMCMNLLESLSTTPTDHLTSPPRSARLKVVSNPHVAQAARKQSTSRKPFAPPRILTPQSPPRQPSPSPCSDHSRSIDLSSLGHQHPHKRAPPSRDTPRPRPTDPGRELTAPSQLPWTRERSSRDGRDTFCRAAFRAGSHDMSGRTWQGQPPKKKTDPILSDRFLRGGQNGWMRH